MKVQALLRVLFPPLVKIPPATPQADPKAIRRIVASLSRGNLNLRLGRYVTAEQMEERKRKLAQRPGY